MSLGASLRMTTIALRVASAAEAEHLRNLGCEAAQGSLLGPPQSAAAIDAML
jgi:EAL domain-containing protein (putative c-di-GMP-specific phosphodiesterase class I)